MNYLNGGYVMIKHNATLKDLAAAYKSNRPVLVYDENQKAHWAQINETVTTETIDDEVVTTYTYSYQLLNDIASLVDSAGNPRFIEGDGDAAVISGYDISYCKWSLSGTHLMFVVSGVISNGTAIANNTGLAVFKLPDWIMNKIYPVFANSIIETKSVDYRGVNDWSSQGSSAYIAKYSNGISIVSGSITATADRGFRIQFDLLIDTDYSE